jgi:O-antigen/teichoic acid export membrane protein
LVVLLVLRHEGPLSIDLVFMTRGACVIAVSFVAMAALRPQPRFDWHGYHDALRYGFPLLLTTFIYALTDMTDRWFLAEFSGVVAVGIYALHLKAAAVMAQAIVVPFGLWFPTERFKRLDDPDQGQLFFRRTAAALSVICGYLSGVVWLARDLVLPLIAPGVVASPLVLACCLGAVTCLALSHAVNVGMLMPGHTGKNVTCTAIAVVAAVVAAAILVPLFGSDGAAVSRLLAGVVLVGVTAAMSNRIFAVAFPFLGMAVYFAASAIAAAVIDHVGTGQGLGYVALELAAWTAVSVLVGGLLWNTVRAPGLGPIGVVKAPAPLETGS